MPAEAINKPDSMRALHSLGLGIILCASTLAYSQNAPTAVNACYQAYRDAAYREAMDLCEPIAETGDADAAFIMASLLAMDTLGIRNFPASVYWLERAAESGHIEAAYNLGVSYQEGHGVDEDISAAARWYRLAADDGSAKAQRSLAYLYEYGLGLQQSYELAFYWYRKSAENGLPTSQLKLGLMYLEGIGTAGNQQRGFDWIRKAAAAGLEDAQLSLALLLDGNGLGEGIQWYERAAARDNIYALHNLAVIYLRGEQAGRDLERALAYAERSIALGNTDSISLKQDIEAAMVEQKVGGVSGPVTSAESQAPDIRKNLDSPPVADVEPDTIVTEQTTNQRPAVNSTPSRSDITGDEAVAQEEPGWERSPEWLQARSPSRYTIQLSVTEKIKGLYRHIREHGLEDAAAIFPTVKDGRRVYVLIYGDFESRTSANAALVDLPAEVQKDHWIRRYAEVQKQYL